VAGYNKVLFQKARGAPTDLNAAFLRAFPDLETKTVRMWKSPVLLLGSPLREQIDLYASTPESFVPFGSRGVARLTPAVERLCAHPGQRIGIDVYVENTSSEAFPVGEGVFGLSYHLVDHDNPRVWLPTSLAPGEHCVLCMSVTAPIAPGKYQLEVDLVWEGVMWFKDVGNPTAIIPLLVE
jgi:hypothetical protein